jgi:hypothetical protein
VNGERVLACCALLVAAACGPSWKDVSRTLAEPDAGASEPRRDRQRSYYDQEATRPRSEVAVLLYPDGHSVKDGLERSWTPEGKLEFERGWRAGEPDGLWRTWWPDGSPRFEYRYGGEPDLMRWWHASGALSSWGPARNGMREGAWRGRHPSGAPAFEGAFEAGQRAGAWTFWHPDGSLAERGAYAGGARVGTWESHAQGALPGSAPEWPADP